MRGAQAYQIELSAADGRARAWLHEHGDVLEDVARESGASAMTVRLTHDAVGRFRNTFPEHACEPAE